MKKILILILMIIMIFPKNILALGSIDINTSDIYVEKGKSTPLNISFNNAAGRINIESSNSNIVSVSDETAFLDMDSKIITISGISKGNSIVKISAVDVNTYDREDLTGSVYNINVHVYTKGDVDNNDKVDLNDVVALLKKYLDNNISTGDISVGDMDGNNIIGLNDIILLIREYLNN